MVKTVTYKGKEYKVEITWGTEAYHVSIDGKGYCKSIRVDMLNDLEKMKKIIIEAIEYKPDLYLLEEWDGKL
jgi:DNA-binding protein YbaB